MNHRSFATFIALVLLAQSFALSRAEAQVLVYRIEITSESGINYHPFEGGYFAAPLLGGAGSFLFTSSEDGFTYTASDSSGRLFTAVDTSNEKKAVVSATTGSGTAHGAFVVFGAIDHLLKVNSPTVTLSVRVGQVLTGSAVSADDESTASAPATDGSIGSAGISKMRLVLDEPETNYANDHGLSLSQTMEELKLELERRGYSDGSATPTPTPTTTTTPTTSATTSTTGTGSGQ
jgi:hypothetical protein